MISSNQCLKGNSWGSPEFRHLCLWMILTLNPDLSTRRTPFLPHMFMQQLKKKKKNSSNLISGSFPHNILFFTYSRSPDCGGGRKVGGGQQELSSTWSFGLSVVETTSSEHWYSQGQRKERPGNYAGPVLALAKSDNHHFYLQFLARIGNMPQSNCKGAGHLCAQ